MNTYDNKQAQQFHDGDVRVVVRAIERIDGTLVMVRTRIGTEYFEVPPDYDVAVTEMVADLMEKSEMRNPEFDHAVVDGDDTISPDALAEVLITGVPE